MKGTYDFVVLFLKYALKFEKLGKNYRFFLDQCFKIWWESRQVIPTCRAPVRCWALTSTFRFLQGSWKGAAYVHFTDEETEAQSPYGASLGHMAVSGRVGFQAHSCLTAKHRSFPPTAGQWSSEEGNGWGWKHWHLVPGWLPWAQRAETLATRGHFGRMTSEGRECWEGVQASRACSQRHSPIATKLFLNGAIRRK